MKPSFKAYLEDKGYKELPNENFFIEPQGELFDLSCHSPLCVTEKIHLFHMFNVKNLTLTKIDLRHKNYTLKNIHLFFL
jgi:hypothetical protein